MRNLKLLDSIHCHQDQVKNTQCISVDCDTGQIYCATNTELVGLDPKTGEVFYIHVMLKLAHKRDSSKQCRPKSDAAKCGI